MAEVDAYLGIDEDEADVFLHARQLVKLAPSVVTLFFDITSSTLHHHFGITL